jgi:hypothetical protein
MEQIPKRQQYEQTEKVPVFRDIWQFIIKLILALLVIAWFVREYLQDKELNPIKLIILLIVLCVIIWLIIKQRHFVCLKCKLTDPGGCVKGDPNIISGKLLEPVVEAAYGWGFSHYILELRSPNGTLLSNVIIYPDSSANPDTSLTQGNYAVTSGTLGWIDVGKAVTDAGVQLLSSTTFEITLRVFDYYGGEKSTPCKINFDVSVNEIFIKRVGIPWAATYTDPDDPLRKTDDSSAELATIGGAMHVRGAANIYGCTGQKIKEYTIWAIPDPTFSFAQPAPFNPVTPGTDWVQLTHIEFTTRTVDGTIFTADEVRAYNTLDGDPAPDILTNVWGTRLECISFPPPPPPPILPGILICKKIPSLIHSGFDSNNQLKPHKLHPDHLGGTGKFTFLLQVIDNNGNQYYDIQRAWVDNEKEIAEITGVAGIKACQDLYMKDSKGNFKTVNIEGTAWDPLIDPADTTTPTSDNFDKYILQFQKQGATGWEEIVTSNSPVPPRPNPVGVGTLVKWDLENLDAASNPKGYPTDQLLGDGESCTYNLYLRVYDLTYVSESSPSAHYDWEVFPIKIINGKEPKP